MFELQTMMSLEIDSAHAPLTIKFTGHNSRTLVVTLLLPFLKFHFDMDFGIMHLQGGICQ